MLENFSETGQLPTLAEYRSEKNPQIMTIAKRLIFLLAVPLAVILAIGLATRMEIKQIEESTRFVPESRIVALARIGDTSRTYAEKAISTRIRQECDA